MSTEEEYDNLLYQIYKDLEKKTTTSKNIPNMNTTILNGKLLISNIGEICSIIDRDPLLIDKFFSSELGIITTYANGQLKLGIIVPRNNLEKIYEKFKNKYVYCSSCKGSNTIFEKDMLRCSDCLSEKFVS